MLNTVRSRRGSVAFLAVGAVAVSALIVGSATLTALSNSRSKLLRGFFKDQPTSVLEAIRSRAVRDLADKMRNPEDGSNANGTLNYILTPKTGFNPDFNVSYPHVYGKGEFQLPVVNAGIPVLDTERSGGAGNADSSLVMFTAPETDPKVWIEASGSSCEVVLHIKTKLCTKIMSKRISFGSGVTGLGVNWDPVCPSDSLQEVESQTFVNVGSTLFAGNQAGQCTVADGGGGGGGNPGLTIEGYWRPVVVHSQQPELPQCPKGLFQMWRGYSYLGSVINDGYNSPQDLAGAGSCIERFQGNNPQNNGPLMAMQCTKDSCNYQTTGHYSTFLVTQGSGGNNWLLDFSNNDKILLAPSLISRCVVCQSTRPVIVKHSYAATVPACPNGWVSQWTGFSFAGGAIEADADYPQDLADTGSCLKIFIPNPITRCNTDNCDRGAVFSTQLHMWLLNLSTQADFSSQNSTDYWLQISNRISRCNVCLKN